ncbi:MAG: V-type ATP synthase subunit I [Planctomycetota bacterium]
MAKVYVVSRRGDRDRLLDALGDLGVVHLKPVDPARAVAEEQTLAAIAELDKASQALAGVGPAGPAPDISPLEAAREVLRIHRGSAERKSRLAALHRQLQQLAAWGEVRLEQLQQLREAGIDVKFFTVPADEIEQVRAECVEVLGERPGKKLLVGVIDRSGQFEPPQSAQPVEPPRRDRPSIRAEAAEIDAALKKDTDRLRQLAPLAEAMRSERERLAEKANYVVAARSGLDEGGLFAVQGWAPQEQARTLADRLAAFDLRAAVQASAPAKDDQPPTLISYPKWARPIKALFDMLGTFPGYREIDLSPFFMVALPLFAAIIIGDAGYGLVFFLAGLMLQRRARASEKSPGNHLLMVIGLATVGWGLLTGSIFGVSPRDMIEAGGLWSPVGNAFSRVHVIGAGEQDAKEALMKISFILGTIHLCLAQLRRGLALLPSIRALANLGWALFLVGMLGIVWYLFFNSQTVPPGALHPATAWLLIIGAAGAILFAAPSRNIAKMILHGLGQFPLAALSTFSDTLSYIRLMAVGLASAIIAQTFNGLALNLAEAATWAAAAPVVLFGHALNIGLCVIAILAHGVRLNMLEFSNNAGVQWAGYPYEPFSRKQSKES